MDPVASLLDGPRARGAFLLRACFDPPWCLQIADEAPLTVLAVVAGEAHLEGERLLPGDVALRVGPAPYRLGDAPDRDPDAVILPGQRCASPDGRPLDLADLGVRSWGEVDGGTQVVTGVYEQVSSVCSRLLDALPAQLVVRADELDSPLVALLAGEVVREGPGQDAVLDRLLDLLLVTALRRWLARADERTSGWPLAAADAIVGPALRSLESDPARAWTVAALAAEGHVSRAAFARRFSALLGEGPLGYLTRWRLDLAADLLLEPGTTLAAVAEQVGYGSAYALSAAFKRERGVSPQAHRATALAGPTVPQPARSERPVMA